MTTSFFFFHFSPLLLSRLQRLEEVAGSVLTQCSTLSDTLDQLEEDVGEFESSCTSLPPETLEERATIIREKLQVQHVQCTCACVSIVHLEGPCAFVQCPDASRRLNRPRVEHTHICVRLRLREVSGCCVCRVSVRPRFRLCVRVFVRASAPWIFVCVRACARAFVRVRALEYIRDRSRAYN